MSAENIESAASLSVVVPCFNEAEGISAFHSRMMAAVDSLELSAEIIYVNDGSTDETLYRLRQLTWPKGQIVLVNLARNHGHQLAVTAGLAQSRGMRVLIIDADLQDPPELLQGMMEIMDTGVDVVYGQRRTRKGETYFKLATANMFYRLLRSLAGVSIPRDTGDFRLVSRRIVDILNEMPEPHRFLRGMVSWVGFSQQPVIYDRDERFAGSTHYPLRKMISLAIDAITGFATAPLRFFFYVSILSLVATVILSGWVVFSLIMGAVPGWASIILVILFFSSMQMFGLALIAEYVGRGFIQGKRRPLFMVESIDRRIPTWSAGSESNK